MPRNLIPLIAGCRYSRQIVSCGTGAPAQNNAAGATSISVAWPPGGAMAANVITFLVVALKPGTANAGSVATPGGWTLAGEHIGGGYGGTLGVGTGNCRVYLFTKAADNTAAGSLSVALTPNGVGGVAAAVMGRIEKLSGTWSPVVTRLSEATADVQVGVYPIAPALIVTPGDWMIYAWATSEAFLSPSGFSVPGTAPVSPTLSAGPSSVNGNRVTALSAGRRVRRGFVLPSALLTAPVGNICRGPMIAARFRVR